jgi:hypothetical protein
MPAPLRCPTVIESITATLGLLPRGRAWPANDAGGILARFLDWLDGLAAVPSAYPAGFVQAGFFAAIGAFRNYLETRLCALRLEFWCATMSETRDQWMADYGLPDPCDPFPDLCVKVSAIGGARCEYFNSIIARLGWTAECYERTARCGMQAGCSGGVAGGSYAIAGDSSYLGLIVQVHTGDPIVLPTVASLYRPGRAGCIRAGQHPSCDTIESPSVQPIRCLMDRIAPAHVTIQYVT